MNKFVLQGLTTVEELVLEMLPYGAAAVMEPVIYCEDEEMLHATAIVTTKLTTPRFLFASLEVGVPIA